MLTDEELLHAAKCLALGRILRLGSRPFQEGDIEQYERCKDILTAKTPEELDRFRIHWTEAEQ